VTSRVKYLWSRVEKEAEKQSGSGGAESGQQGEPGKKGKPIASKKEEQKVVQEGKVGDDRRSQSGSTAEGLTKISGIAKGKHAAMTGKEDGGPGAGVKTVRQHLQGCGDGQKEWESSNGGVQGDVANLEENGPTWASLHLKELRFEGSCRPAKRVCGFHAYMAIKDAESKGWIPKGSVEVPDEAQGSPTFDKKLMEIYLHDSLENASSPCSESPPNAWSPENTPKVGDFL
jgi:hypothetical protein